MTNDMSAVQQTMNKSTEEVRLERSWLLAHQLRCCPPDHVLAGEMSDELKGHLATCPFCRVDRAVPMPQVMLEPDAADGREKPLPQPGELWSLQPACGGWGPKNRYYNPPVVLVIGMTSPDYVQVVQTSGAIELAGPDDLLLDNGLSGFAEPWNQYTLQTGNLYTCLGHISRQRIDELHQHIAAEHSAPAPGSLLWFFRQLEVETGWFFAAQALDAFQEQPENISVDSILNIPTEQLAADLRQLPVVLPDIDLSSSSADILARAMPADDLLPLAAADLKPQALQILLFIVEQGKIRTAEMIRGHLTLLDMKKSTLHVSGCCRSDLPDDACWVFRWQSDAWSVQPLPGQSGACEGVFWAVFPITEITCPEQGELIVRILVQR